MENYIVINGKKAELTEEQLKKLGIEVKNDPFERKPGKIYYGIWHDGYVCCFSDQPEEEEKRYYDVGNYCRDETIMKQRALHETLNRLLWRFSIQNGSDNMDWTNWLQDKWVISFNYKDDCFSIDDMPGIKNFNPCFTSREVAQRAIDEIIKPFIKEHPEFVW